MKRLSRRELAQILVESLGTKDEKRRIKQVSAHLLETGRAKQIELLIRDVELQAQRSYGHVTARVATAFEIDTSTRKKIEQEVTSLSHAKSVEIIEEIDTSLLGGTIIATPEMEVDLSLRGKLQRLKEIEI